ncbi:thioesterase [Streptomyces sp. SID13666]|uniref:thioesterase II family protein n=1 Tax=unclassified Streptomyces TaxID=2593676 RepID=UPI001106131C|nr:MULTISPECIES: alpha/beta fold hydrolase [unclassified Streptomyces]NEA57184.1 thioesterase [Streptomyces sp. SID13666]NEA74278.1 thioesterase [Streptomyces sp. SID13588]QNA71962.1 thioesterase [Streptomyces sp. So13.3]
MPLHHHPLTIQQHRDPTGAWFPAADTHAPATLQLICFSYAGGTPSVFRDWQRQLGDGVQVVPVLLPGRGLRLREPPYTDMGPLAADAATALVEFGLTPDFALFGHSMGALLAYEVACELRRRGHREPRHLFVSGSRAPHLYGTRQDHTLSDDDLRRLVHDLGGLGDDHVTARSYLDRRLPVLRADLRVCETYRWTPRRPLRCPMTAFSGTDDPIATAAGTEAWRECTTGSLLRRHLPGDHFFLTGASRLRLLRELRGELDRLRPDQEARTLTARRTPSWTH